MNRLWILAGLLLCVSSAVFMGWVIASIFGLGKGIIIVAGIIGFFGGCVCLSPPEWALSPDKE